MWATNPRLNISHQIKAGFSLPCHFAVSQGAVCCALVTSGLGQEGPDPWMATSPLGRYKDEDSEPRSQGGQCESESDKDIATAPL